MGLAKNIRGLTIEINADVSGLKGALGQASIEANKFSEKLDKIGAKIGDVGRSLTKNVTTPIVAGFTAAIKTTADFDDAMAKVAAVSGATGDDFDMLRDRAREMGELTLHSATDVADAMYYMGLAGWNAQQIYAGIPGVLDLATASGEDLARVSDIVTDALTAFGLEAEETGHFVDVLAQASRSSNTTVDQLGEAFKYVAPMAGAMSYSIDDIAMALGLMANNGIKGSMAGTALRNIIQRMAKPTKESGDAMEALGLSLLNADGSAKSFSDVMGDMRNAFGGLLTPTAELQLQIDELNKQMDDGTISEEEYVEQLSALSDAAYGAGSAEKIRYAAMLAGARGMPGLLAIVNAATGDYENLAGAIDQADGATREMSSLMENTTTGQFKILISKLSELAIQFGDILTPIIRQVIDYLKGIVDYLNDLDEPTKQMIIKIAAIAAAIGPLLLVISGLINGISSLAAAFSFIVSPAGLIVVALAAVAAGIIYLWNTNEDFRKKVKEIWENIKNTISNVIDSLKPVFDALVWTIQNLWEAIKEHLSGVLETARNIINAIMDAINALLGVFQGLIEFITGAFSRDWDKAFHGLTTSATSAFTGVLNSATNIFDSMYKKISGIVGKLKGIFDFEWSLPKIKLPHFSWSWSDVGGLIKLPKIKVDWYRKAYENPWLFTSPTVVGGRGFGDGVGGELVYGHDQLMRDIASASGSGVTVNVYASDNMNIKQLTDEIERRLAQVQRRRNSAYA